MEVEVEEEVAAAAEVEEAAAAAVEVEEAVEEAVEERCFLSCSLLPRRLLPDPRKWAGLRAVGALLSPAIWRGGQRPRGPSPHRSPTARARGLSRRPTR